MIPFLRRAALRTAVELPLKPRSNIMSLCAMLESLNTQDDDTAANIMAEALNSDQRIRAHLGQDIAFDTVSLRRVAASLAQHNAGLERAIRGEAYQATITGSRIAPTPVEET